MEIITGFLDNAGKILGNLFTSPFQQFMDFSAGSEYFGHLNYFVPVSEMIVIGEAWLLCIGAFYAVSALLRAIHILQ